MDLIKNCALEYAALLNTEYVYTLGHKRKSVELRLGFSKTEFAHLAGLHKLHDNARIRSGARDTIFDDIISGHITQEQIEKSVFYSEIADRLQLFQHIREFLAGTNLYFRYDPMRNTFSGIEAKFVIEGPVESVKTYLFLDKKNDGANYFCRSFFPQSGSDYTRNLSKYTLLRKEKKDLLTQTSVVEYDKLK